MSYSYGLVKKMFSNQYYDQKISYHVKGHCSETRVAGSVGGVFITDWEPNDNRCLNFDHFFIGIFQYLQKFVMFEL